MPQSSVLLVSHSLDYSGAPHALLSLARSFRELGCTVDLYSKSRGPLEIDFFRLNVGRYRPDHFYDVCVLNTTLGLYLGRAIGYRARRTFGWVHESPTFNRYNSLMNYASLPLDGISGLLGVADFQVKALRTALPGVDVDRFDLTVGPESNHLNFQNRQEKRGGKIVRVCIVGSEERRKGLYKLSGLNSICSRFPDRKVEIKIIGLGKDFLNNPHPFKVGTNINFSCFGRLDHNSTLGHISQSDILLSLSEDEVKPLIILEAVVAQTLVVASEIPAHVELSEEFSDIVVAECPLELLFSLPMQLIRRECSPSPNLESLSRYSWNEFLERTGAFFL